MNKICFREEAKDWNEALPIGNGFLGAMVFGKTGTERLQILMRERTIQKFENSY